MLHRLKRHPIATHAHFDFTVALTFALPAAVIEPMLYPGLSLDRFTSPVGEELGFLCIALVQTHGMRPSFMPAWLGGSFMLSGYRLFVRYRTPEGRTLRGLQVLRSDTDRRAMVMLGNVFTHYRYELAAIEVSRPEHSLAVKTVTRGGEADLDVSVTTDGPDDVLPRGSPFPDARTARRFAGPMPFTFSYEPETQSMVRIEGRRRGWRPKMVDAEVRRATYFAAHGLPEPRLASAFMVENVPYSWQRGVVAPIEAA